MSIIIKGMEMPKSCRACMFSRTDIRNIDWCALTGEDLPCDCPIIEVPPHGRLIDADALYEMCALDTSTDVMASTKRINEYMQLKIDDAPTIIEAEEDE